MDELAHAAKADPVDFRRKHLKPGSRHLKVLEEVAKRSGWGAPLPEGVGRGVAIVESFKTIVAHVIEASVKEDGSPKVLKVTTVVDAVSRRIPRTVRVADAGLRALVAMATIVDFLLAWHARAHATRTGGTGMPRGSRLSGAAVQEIGSIIRRLRDEQGLTIMIVEQNLQLIRSVADYCLVMDKGQLIDRILPGDLEDPEVAKRYLAI